MEDSSSVLGLDGRSTFRAQQMTFSSPYTNICIRAHACGELTLHL